MNKKVKYWITPEEEKFLTDKAVEIAMELHKVAWNDFLEERRKQNRPLEYKHVTDDHYQAVFAAGLLRGCATGLVFGCTNVPEMDNEQDEQTKGGNNGQDN